MRRGGREIRTNLPVIKSSLINLIVFDSVELDVTLELGQSSIEKQGLRDYSIDPQAIYQDLFYFASS